MQNHSFVHVAAIVIASGGCVQPLQPGRTGTGGTGNSGTGSGGEGGPNPDGSTSCPVIEAPAEVQPLAPTVDAVSTCATIATTGATWGPPANPSGMTTDARASIVGRWIPCGSADFSAVPHAAVEFGANSRWQLLTTDAAGALVPMAAATRGARGVYYALGTGQLNVMSDENPPAASVTFFGFTPDMNAVVFQQTKPADAAVAAYARTMASPLNGSDNPPPITDGRCSMVGTWVAPAGGVAPALAFSFDSVGNFGMQLATSTACDLVPAGTYAFSAAAFQITTNAGGCPWWYSAGYSAAFDGACTQVTLTPVWDNCTGGRTYLTGTTVLTRRYIPMPN